MGNILGQEKTKKNTHIVHCAARKNQWLTNIKLSERMT